MKNIRKSVSVLLAFIIVVSLFTIIPFESGAVSGVQYIENALGTALTKR